VGIDASLCDRLLAEFGSESALTRTISQKSRNHELGSVANGVHRAVLDDNALICGQESLQWRDNLSKVRLVAVVVVAVLSVENIV
jgi:hypothetical protein